MEVERPKQADYYPAEAEPPELDHGRVASLVIAFGLILFGSLGVVQFVVSWVGAIVLVGAAITAPLVFAMRSPR